MMLDVVTTSVEAIAVYKDQMNVTRVNLSAS